MLLAQTACPATDANLPPPLAGWSAPAQAFEPGKAVMLDTSDAPPPAGAKPGRTATIGFRIDKPGTYGIALDQPGWIDVLPGVSGGEALESVRHGHGPECSSIRKIVRFELAPGVYRLTLTGLSGPKAKVMLVEGE